MQRCKNLHKEERPEPLLQMRLVGKMNDFDRRLWNDYMQRRNQQNPNTVSTKMNSLAFNHKLIEKKESADNKYNKIPNMTSAMHKVRNNNRTHNLNMVNATTSKTRTK